MTVQGWNYTEVATMPEDERKRWSKKCEEYQDKMSDELDRAKAK
jgi:hypothetical protein